MLFAIAPNYARFYAVTVSTKTVGLVLEVASYPIETVSVLPLNGSNSLLVPVLSLKLLLVILMLAIYVWLIFAGPVTNNL